MCVYVRDTEREREYEENERKPLNRERSIYREGNLTIQNTNTCLQRNSESEPACAVGCSIGKHHQIFVVF